MCVRNSQATQMEQLFAVALYAADRRATQLRAFLSRRPTNSGSTQLAPGVTIISLSKPISQVSRVDRSASGSQAGALCVLAQPFCNSLKAFGCRRDQQIPTGL